MIHVVHYDTKCTVWYSLDSSIPTQYWNGTMKRDCTVWSDCITRTSTDSKTRNNRKARHKQMLSSLCHNFHHQKNRQLIPFEWGASLRDQTEQKGIRDESESGQTGVSATSDQVPKIVYSGHNSYITTGKKIVWDATYEFASCSHGSPFTFIHCQSLDIDVPYPNRFQKLSVLICDFAREDSNRLFGKSGCQTSLERRVFHRSL